MRAAIIGLGCIAEVHIAAIRANEGEIVAVCDVDLKKAEEFSKRHSLSCPIYENYIELYEKEMPDVVHICTPHYLHCDMICEALSRNINAFSEKPVAISYEQLDKIRAYVKSSKAQLGVSHQNRYNEPIKYARELLSGSEILSAVGVVAWCRDEKYYAAGEWRGKWATEGGGLVINQAIHTLDLLMDFCGMPESVIAHTHNDTLKGIIEVEDTCTALFKLASGGRFSLLGTNGLTASLPCVAVIKSREHTVMIYNNDYLVVDGKEVKKEDTVKLIGKWEWGTGHAKIVRDFYRHIESGKPFPLGIDEAEKAIRLILALYSSNGEETKII